MKVQGQIIKIAKCQMLQARGDKDAQLLSTSNLINPITTVAVETSKIICSIIDQIKSQLSFATTT